jgi:stearoyl-CoA desaturase (delta-9 desaturase)
VYGSQRYDTGDDSKNNFWLALITLGEGWHNNHHYYPASTRQGFYWWEVDITFYILKAMAWIGLVWDVRGVPAHVRDEKSKAA